MTKRVLIKVPGVEPGLDSQRGHHPESEDACANDGHDPMDPGLHRPSVPAGKRVSKRSA